MSWFPYKELSLIESTQSLHEFRCILHSQYCPSIKEFIVFSLEFPFGLNWAEHHSIYVVSIIIIIILFFFFLVNADYCV